MCNRKNMLTNHPQALSALKAGPIFFKGNLSHPFKKLCYLIVFFLHISPRAFCHISEQLLKVCAMPHAQGNELKDLLERAWTDHFSCQNKTNTVLSSN